MNHPINHLDVARKVANAYSSPDWRPTADVAELTHALLHAVLALADIIRLNDAQPGPAVGIATPHFGEDTCPAFIDFGNHREPCAGPAGHDGWHASAPFMVDDKLRSGSTWR